MPVAELAEWCRRAFELVVEGQSVTRVAKDFGIGEWCVRREPGQDDADLGRVKSRTSDERRELVELRSRNCVLEMEVDSFKRASVYSRVTTSSQIWIPVRPGTGLSGVPVSVVVRWPRERERAAESGSTGWCWYGSTQ